MRLWSKRFLLRHKKIIVILNLKLQLFPALQNSTTFSIKSNVVLPQPFVADKW